MTRVRLLFLLERTCGYLALLAALWLSQPRHVWWMWLLAFALSAWTSWDQWKRPDETAPLMRRGIAMETLAILALVAIFRDALPIFLFVSPLARAGIHLGWSRAAIVASVAMASAPVAWTWMHAPLWMVVAQPIVIVAAMVYAGVMGELVRERDRLRRHAHGWRAASDISGACA